MNIITLTLSPAFDIHCRAHALALGRENLLLPELSMAGGKGINISRALAENGCQSLALVALGEENAPAFERALDAHGLSRRVLAIPGRIRQNITVHVPGQPETRLSFPASPAPAELLPRLAELLDPLVGPDTVLTVTGRIPEGVDLGALTALLVRLRDRGIRLVVDSRSFTLDMLLALKPWLIKPNQEEISQYLLRPVEAPEDALREALALHRAGIGHVMISLGERGALLACREGVFLATPPRVEVLSTVGAGDSAIAGFLSSPDPSPIARLSRAVAFGSAACLTPGTLPPTPEAVARLLPLVRITSLPQG